MRSREKANYDDGRHTTLTGREAYNIYGAAVVNIFSNYVGSFLFAADTSFLALGQVGELWDEIVIAKHPDRAALWKMSTSPA